MTAREEFLWRENERLLAAWRCVKATVQAMRERTMTGMEVDANGPERPRLAGIYDSLSWAAMLLDEGTPWLAPAMEPLVVLETPEQRLRFLATVYDKPAEEVTAPHYVGHHVEGEDHFARAFPGEERPR